MPHIQLGYALSSEEHDGNKLVDLAKRAEETGFSFAFISDHFHPWLDSQGHSPFVWSVIGGIARETKNLKLGTGVTCPIIRTHPVIIAQAAATAAQMMEGRFMLGLGTGENLNEHVVGEGWPPIGIRQEMLIEAIDIMRELWQGKMTTIYGNYFVVEDARIYTLPQNLPPILVASSGPKSAKIAAEKADGFISTNPDKQLIDTYTKHAGNNSPKYGQVTVAYADSEEKGKEIAMKYWTNTALRGPLNVELRIPKYFEQAAQMVEQHDLAEQVVVGSDPEKHIKAIREFIDAGYDHVYVHQIGPEQEEFFGFYEKEVLPEFK